MEKLMFVSGYTVNTSYQKEILSLIESMEKFNLPYKVYPYENQGNWILNCHYKTEIFKKAFEEFKCNIVWVDGDAVFRQEPTLLYKIQQDVAAAMYMNTTTPSASVLCGGTILISARNLLTVVDLWDKENKLFRKRYDQQNLQTVVERNQNVSFYNLPLSYFKIFDRNMGTKPVIEHFQASRRFKAEVNSNGTRLK